jgi:diacylglycerol kinase
MPLSPHPATCPDVLARPEVPPLPGDGPLGPLPPAEGKKRRRWRDKFRVAFRGIKMGIRGHSSFAVHFFFTALVLAAAVILRCGVLEWCLLLGCIGMVLTAELFNSAVETLFRGLDQATRERVWPCLDIAAGAVLLASVVAAVIGTIVFVRQLAILFPMW